MNKLSERISSGDISQEVVGVVAVECRRASEQATGYTPATEIDWDVVADAAITALLRALGE